MFKTLLLVTYVSFSGQISTSEYAMESMESCQASSRQIRDRVKAGKVSTRCRKDGREIVPPGEGRVVLKSLG